MARTGLGDGQAGVRGFARRVVVSWHKTAVIDGKPVTYTLRVTHVYRCEDGVWKTVHRHGDHVDRSLGR